MSRSFSGSLAAKRLVVGSDSIGKDVLEVGGNANFAGSVNVMGTMSAVSITSSEHVLISDALIGLAVGNTGDVLDTGFVVEYVGEGETSRHGGFFRSAATKEWNLFKDSTEADLPGRAVIGTTVPGYALADLNVGSSNVFEVQVAVKESTASTRSTVQRTDQETLLVHNGRFEGEELLNTSLNDRPISLVSVSEDSFRFSLQEEPEEEESVQDNVFVAGRNDILLRRNTSINGGLEVTGPTTLVSALTLPSPPIIAKSITLTAIHNRRSSLIIPTESLNISLPTPSTSSGLVFALVLGVDLNMFTVNVQSGDGTMRGYLTNASLPFHQTRHVSDISSIEFVLGRAKAGDVLKLVDSGSFWSVQGWCQGTLEGSGFETGIVFQEISAQLSPTSFNDGLVNEEYEFVLSTTGITQSSTVEILYSFGDGATGVEEIDFVEPPLTTLAHVWNDPGVFVVTAYVRDLTGNLLAFATPSTIEINDPSVEFTPLLVNDAIAGQPYTFNVTVTGYRPNSSKQLVLLATWGDGTSTQQTFTMSFDENGSTTIPLSKAWSTQGTFTVSLTLQTVGGVVLATAPDTALVNAINPSVSMQPSSIPDGVVETTYNFQLTISGFTPFSTRDLIINVIWGDNSSSIQTYSLTFDGSGSTTIQYSKQWNSEGTFNVTTSLFSAIGTPLFSGVTATVVIEPLAPIIPQVSVEARDPVAPNQLFNNADYIFDVSVSQLEEHIGRTLSVVVLWAEGTSSALSGEITNNTMNFETTFGYSLQIEEDTQVTIGARITIQYVDEGTVLTPVDITLDNVRTYLILPNQ